MSFNADFNLNALKDTHDYSCFLARLDEYRHLMTYSPGARPDLAAEAVGVRQDEQDRARRGRGRRRCRRRHVPGLSLLRRNKPRGRSRRGAQHQAAAHLDFPVPI
jgi:hypothetical protein